jgi:5'-deoxynucleotidase YfbR-like HD superfamily hydrolase
MRSRTEGPGDPGHEIATSLRFAGLVQRYHTWPTTRKQNVGEHSWQVWRVYYALFGVPPSEVSLHIMMHDAPELQTGDPPFPVKMLNPTLKAGYDELEKSAYSEFGVRMPVLDVREAWRIKTADLIEMLEFGMEEVQMGNRLAQPIIDRIGKTMRERIEAVRSQPPHERMTGVPNVDCDQVEDYLDVLLQRHVKLMGQHRA